MAREFYKKGGMNKSILITIVVMALIIVGGLVYILNGAYQKSQTNKLTNAAVYGANVRDVQLFAGSVNCQPVIVMAFDENGNQMQKALMEINPACSQVYQQTAAQLLAAAQQAQAQ